MTQRQRSPENHPLQDDIGPGLRRQRDRRGEGPAKPGLGSDDQLDLVAPSGVNQRDHGSAEDSAAGGGELSFDDDEVMADRNGPSDPDRGPGGKRS